MKTFDINTVSHKFKYGVDIETVLTQEMSQYIFDNSYGYAIGNVNL